MPPRIQKLPDHLITKIAAGEVVERPASALKELIENSLDAGATQISIVVEGAGRTRLQVSDNGSGMTQEEALLSLERHATSKISQLDDLESLSTFGFRGEAIPSLAAVSRFRLTTRSEEQDSAWEIEVEGGKILSQKPVAREPGTTLEIRDLFFNTPARFKFLKADSTERAQCLKVVEEMAFSALHAGFHMQLEKAKPIGFPTKTFGNDGLSTFGNDGLSTFGNDGLPSSGNDFQLEALKNRAEDVWGPKWRSNSLSIKSKAPYMSLWGWVTHPLSHEATARHQLLFINRRPVVHRRITRAVYEAFRGQLPSMRHPGWILNLDVDPRAVDVNVHPTKREVKLTFENEIFGFVMNSVQKSLASLNEISVSALSKGGHNAAEAEYKSPQQTSGPYGSPIPWASQSLHELYRPLPMNTAKGSPPLPSSFDFMEPPPEGLGDNAMGLKELTALAQLDRLFIVASHPQGVCVVDQHAAHEKIIYEALIKNLETQTPSVQMLLVPFNWEVARSVVQHLKGSLELMNKLGFVMEWFGDDTVLVKGYPQILGEKFDLSSLLDGLSDVFAEKGRDFQHSMAASMACKTAVKAGDSLGLKECQQILNNLPLLESPWTCPHGRPTVVRLSFEELKRRFKRN